MVSHWLFISKNYPFGFIFTQRQEKFWDNKKEEATAEILRRPETASDETNMKKCTSFLDLKFVRKRTKFFVFFAARVLLVSAGLLLVDLDDVVLFHFQLLGCLVVVDAAAVEEEPKRVDRNADPFRVALLQLAHLRRHLDPGNEADLVENGTF